MKDDRRAVRDNDKSRPLVAFGRTLEQIKADRTLVKGRER
jgi:hypothetical protein